MLASETYKGSLRPSPILGRSAQLVQLGELQVQTCNHLLSFKGRNMQLLICIRCRVRKSGRYPVLMCHLTLEERSRVHRIQLK